MKRLIFILWVLVSAAACGQVMSIGGMMLPRGSAAPTPCTEGYGLLYNWYAAADARKITSSDDWIVPQYTNYNTLRLYVDPTGTITSNTAGGKLKETGTTYWNSPNTGATNEYNFNARGSSARLASNGTFSPLKTIAHFWTTTDLGGISRRSINMTYSTGLLTITGISSVGNGHCIRLLYTGAGTPTEYVGNDSKKYRVITIGTQTWLADNLAETRFRDGSIIPWYGADPANYFTNAEWAALTTAGCCAYNNDMANVGCDFAFPTE